MRDRDEEEDTGETMAGFVGTQVSAAAPTPTDSLMSAVTRIAGRYEIQGLLGMGGMGSVYKVRDIELDEVVALKMLRPDLVSVPGILARFRQEVKLARRVSHNNVVRTFDLGEHGDERFLTMEFIDGRSVGRRLEDDGAFPVETALRIIRDVCAGVAAAHAAGVLHRDLKPDNVLVAGDFERVAISDFGIARARFEAQLARTAGGVVGTPAYMAPEQIQVGSEVGPRADIYAIGAVLYELLTGRRAWPGNEPFAVALARLTRPPPDPRAIRTSVPEALSAIVLRAMATRAEDRFASVDELGEALQTISAAPGSAGETGSRLTPPRPFGLPIAEAKTVAVLPFRNAGAPDDAYVADGLTEELIDGLSNTRALKVRPLGAVVALAGKGGDPRDLGRTLGVQVVVEGSVRRLGDHLRISARVINVDDGFQVWARRFDCASADVLVTVDNAVRAIAEALTVEAGTERGASADPVVVNLYLRARHELRSGWFGTIAKAGGLLEQAHVRAPDDPGILSLLAMVRARQGFFGDEHAARYLAEGRRFAERACELAPHNGEARLALAQVYWHSADLPAAGRALRAAVDLAPGLAKAQEMLGMILLEVGEVDEARIRLETALSLDPVSPTPRYELIRMHALRGHWTRVDQLLAITGEGDTEKFTHSYLSARLSLWRPDDGPPLPPVPFSPDDPAVPPGTRVALVYIHAIRSIRETRKASEVDRAFLDQAIAPSSRPGRLATIQAQSAAEASGFVGEWELAWKAMEVAVRSGLVDRLWMDSCPVLAPMRADPRWQPLYTTVSDRARSIVAAIRAG